MTNDAVERVAYYLSLVPSLQFHPADAITWRAIQEEGLDHNPDNQKCWFVAVLPISGNDSAALRAREDRAMTMFDDFKHRLFKLSHGRIVKLVDMGNGMIRLVRKAP